MDYDWLARFHPVIVDVVRRDVPFWESYSYRLLRERTRLSTLAVVTEGSGLYELNGETVPLEAGTVFQVFPYSHMLITTTAARPLSFYSVHFQAGVVDWDGGFAVKGERLPLPMAASYGARSGLAERFGELFELWQSKEAGYEWRAKLHLLQTIDLLLKLTPEGAEPSGEVVERAIRLMRERYREELDRDELAEAVSLSPAYFSTLFKKVTGFGPMQYLGKIRVDHAKTLLRTTDLSIAEVAQAVGFTDAFYFTRVFTKATGFSPRDYRKA